MSNIMNRAPHIARDLAAIWRDHMEALDEAALPYLDELSEAVLAAEPMSQWELSDRLCQMVPTTTPGTISRMLKFKFGYTGAELLRARAAA